MATVTDRIQNAELKTPETAARAWAEYSGGYVVLARWQTVGLVVAVGIIIMLSWLLVSTHRHYENYKPLVMREYVDGRVEVLSYDQATFRPTETLVRHFLARFIELHFSRQSRTALARDYASSLMFLADRIRHRPLSADDTPEAIEAFVKDPSSSEVAVVTTKVTLSDVVREATSTGDARIIGGKASVDFTKQSLYATDQAERTAKTYTAQVVFDVLPTVPNHFIPVNPIGLQINSIVIDEAFQ